MNKEAEEADVIMSYALNQSYITLRLLRKEFREKSIGFLADSKRLHQESVIMYKKTLSEKIYCIARKTVYSYKEKRCLSGFGDIVYVSPVDVKYVEKTYSFSASLHCITPGVEKQSTVIEESTNDFDVKCIQIGCLTDFSNDTLNENLYPLIKGIIPYLDNNQLKYKLIIAGRGANSTIENEMKKSQNIQYIGYVDSLSDFYNSIDIVITTVAKKCGVINRILEAWAYAKPVIGYSHNFVPFLKAKNEENYLSADNNEEFYKMLTDIQKGKYDLCSMGQKSKRMVEENYTWEIAARKFLQLFNSIVERKKTDYE